MRKRQRFIGRSKPVGKYRSTLEKRFADLLDEQLKTGEIVRWRYEPQRFRLTDKDKLTTYTPDFSVMLPLGNKIFYEVKGFWTAKSRIKTKLFADQYWEYLVIGVQWKKKQWVYEDFSA